MLRLSFLCVLLLSLAACSSGSGTISNGKTFPGPSGNPDQNSRAQELVDKADKPAVNELSEEDRKALVEQTFSKLVEFGRPVCSGVTGNDLGCNWFDFALKDTPTVNAYPWGANGLSVNKGILEYADNEHEVAYLLAHQMGHILAKHVVENGEYSVANRQGGAAVLVVLLCGASCVQNLPSYGDRIRAEIYQEEWETSFSHSQEREADYIAVYLMENAGYDIEKGRKFLLKMAALNPENGTEAKDKAGYFDLHAFNPAQLSRMLAVKKEYLTKKAAGKELKPTPKIPEKKEYY